MKKAIFVLAAMMLIFSLVSCGSDPSPVVADNNGNEMDVPDFFLMPPQATDAIYGIGVAKSSDLSRSRDLAASRARADIAKQISVKVETMLTDYFQEAGVGDDVQAMQFVESITKEVASIELSGATTKQMYPASDGSIYVLVEYPLNSFVDEQVADVFQRNESAEFAEFKAGQALDRLNAELDDNPPQSSGNETL
ncbi:MAG: LPP20 family lipoprotein [Spirochaetaceae bacterium]|jgi:hypothetical protein|nr:LPP20 family lipoprotein [Spirochaetaceae bacterium]